METADEPARGPLLRKVFDSLPMAIFLADRKGGIRPLNDTVAALLKPHADGGVAPCLRAPLEALRSGDSRTGCALEPLCSGCVVKTAARESMEKKRPIYGREYSITLLLRNAPARFDLLLNCVPITFDGAECVIVMANNITHLKGNRRERLARLERLSAAGAAAASIVHDMRNSLVRILGQVQLLEYQLDDPARMDGCRRIGDAAVHVTKMLNEILAIASGRLRPGLKIKRVNTETFFRNLLDGVTTNSKIALNLAYKGAMKIDEDKLREALWNIVKNADEALQNTRAGKIEISCTASNRSLMICVSDNGPGIPPELCDELFLPGRTARKKHGKGFGLFGAKRVVEAHGGRLWCHSVPEKGTKFFIELPIPAPNDAGAGGVKGSERLFILDHKGNGQPEHRFNGLA